MRARTMQRMMATRAARAALVPQARVTKAGLFLKVVIFEFERGLLYRDGRFEQILPRGRYRFRARTATVRAVDVRPQFVTIPGQELLTADGVTIKLTIAARFEYADLVTAHNAVANVIEDLYMTLQLALRQIVGGTTIEDLLAQRATVGSRMVEVATERMDEIGLRLIEADVKDIMFPGELKKIFAQVVQARQEGVAALEKARGETAALRNLANAARLVAGNPALLQLRLLQATAATPGSTLVVGMPDLLTAKAAAKNTKSK